MSRIEVRVLSFKGSVLPLETVYIAEKTQWVFRPNGMCTWRGRELILRSLRIGPFEQLVGIEGGGGLALSVFDPYATAPQLTMPPCEVGETITLGVYNPTGAPVLLDVDLVGHAAL